MTRSANFRAVLEKSKSSADYLETALEPSADPRAIAFFSKRKEQSAQLRYWSKIGSELPKIRKFINISGFSGPEAE